MDPVQLSLFPEDNIEKIKDDSLYFPTAEQVNKDLIAQLKSEIDTLENMNREKETTINNLVNENQKLKNTINDNELYYLKAMGRQVLHIYGDD